MFSTAKKVLITAFLSFIVLLAATLPLRAFQAYAHTDLTDKVDSLFKEWDRIDSPGAALGIFKDGRITYARGYGMANLEYRIPITPHSVFRTGSVSKHFAAMCIALLAEQKKISLDDDIRKYLPEMPAFDPPVTIRHMLHHTSGVRGYIILQGLAGRSDGYFYRSQEVIDLLSRQKELNFKPGDKYSYSNSGYFLLAQIVGRVSRMKTREFAQKFIFDPLQMEDTHYHDDPNMIVPNRATGYYPRQEGGFKIYTTQLDMIGDGGIFTTIDDFFKWDQNFYANKLGKGTQDLIEVMLTHGKLNNGREIDYALGLEVDRYRGLRRISHGGSFVGYKAHYLRFPDQKFSVVILSNLGSFIPGEIADHIADLYLKDQFTEASTSHERTPEQKKPEPITLPAEQSEEFVGKYYSYELDASAVIRKEKNDLSLRVGRYESVLVPLSPDLFLTTFLNDDAYSLGTSWIEFKRSAKGDIIGFTMAGEDIQNLQFEKLK